MSTRYIIVAAVCLLGTSSTFGFDQDSGAPHERTAALSCTKTQEQCASGHADAGTWQSRAKNKMAALFSIKSLDCVGKRAGTACSCAGAESCVGVCDGNGSCVGETK